MVLPLFLYKLYDFHRKRNRTGIRTGIVRQSFDFFFWVEPSPGLRGGKECGNRGREEAGKLWRGRALYSTRLLVIVFYLFLLIKFRRTTNRGYAASRVGAGGRGGMTSTIVKEKKRKEKKNFK